MPNYHIRVNGEVVAKCGCYDEQLLAECAIENVLRNLHIRYNEDVIWTENADRYTVIMTIKED